jgi:opacity protein-like surface antigen
MKRILLATVIATSSFAYADSGFYTSLKAGVSDTKFDNTEYQSNPEVDVDLTYHNKDVDETVYPNIALAVGFDFSKISKINARAELEYTYKDKVKFTPQTDLLVITTPDFSDSEPAPEGFPGLFENELRSQSLMLNAYYDFKNTSKFTPYLGAGVGVTRIKNKQALNPELFMENDSESDTSNTFTWSANVGVAYQVTENVALDLGYRYVDAGEIEFNTNNSFFFGPEANMKTTADLVSHDYSLGIRYNF